MDYSPFHNLLKRQLRKAFGDSFPIPEEWKDFIRMVDNAYRESDTDRYMLERSLGLSSDELFEINSEMRAIFEVIPDLLFRIGYDGIILDCKTGNPSDLYFPREKLINRKIDGIPVTKVANIFREAITNIARDKEPETVEYSLVFDESEKFFEARFIPFAHDQIVIMVRNITEKRQAEKALIESEEKYRSIFENATEGIFRTNVTGEYIEANPAIARMLGYDSQKEIIGLLGNPEQSPFVIPDDQNRFRELLRTNGSVDGFETQAYRKDGGKIWVSINAHAVKDPTGSTLFYEGTVDNITDTKYAREALFESEEKYRNIVEESHVGVYIIQDDLFRFVNPTFCVIHGYSYDEIIDRMHPKDFIVPESIKTKNEDRHNRSGDGSVTEKLMYRIRRNDGEVRTVRAIANSILYKGRPAVIGTLLDITNEKALEEQLLQSQKLETVGRLAGGIAHDFNNMLGVILGNVQLAKMNLSNNEKIHHYCDSIEKATAKAAGFVKQLLAFSRRQILQLKTFDLNDLLSGFEKMIYRVIGENIEIHFIAEKNLPPVKADEAQINQVLLNLVVNARDAMPDGGRLTIKTSSVNIDEKYGEANQDAAPGPYVLMAISDTGVGMEKDTADKIFEPFFTTKKMGSGLGLSVVYGIIKQHRGFIEVKTGRGRGTTMKIFLPCAEGAVAHSSPDTRPHVKKGNETILIVEDNDDFRDIEAEMLQRLGYRVYKASDGFEGIETFRKLHAEIDLVILDVVMPKMNGREALEGMRLIRPDIPSLFVTGYSLNTIHVDYILEQGIEAIQKPFSFDVLSRKIREILDTGPRSNITEPSQFLMKNASN